MRVVFILLMAASGCGFQPTTAANQTGDDAAAPDDAALSVDAAVAHADAKVFHDAPPCADDDSDGVCNAVDDWPCGAKPTAPPTTFDLHVGTTDFKLSAININGANTLAVIGPGQSLRFQIHNDAKETGCGPGACIDQLEVGWHPTGHRFACIFDQGVGMNTLSKDIDTTTDSNDAATPLVVPTTPGVYEIRASIGQRYGCYKAAQNGPDTLTDDWWLGSEPAAVIAKVCVH